MSLLSAWRDRAPGTVMRVVLGASLALNVALGVDKLYHEFGPRPPRGVDGMISRLASSLGDQDRGTFLSAMEQQRPSFMPALEAMRAARPGVDEAVRRQPFDPERLRTASAAWADRSHEFSVRFGAAVADALGKVSPEGRDRFSQSRPR